MADFLSKETLQLIQDTAISASAAEMLSHSQDPTRYYIECAGKVTPVLIPRRVRHDLVRRLVDLVAIAKREAEEGRFPIVWHCLGGVILQCDEAASRAWPDEDHATMKFHLSNAFARLRGINGFSLSQADLVRILRVDWAGHVIEPDFLPAVRQIKFRRAVSGYSDIQQGKESLGREVENTVVGAGEGSIVETIHLHLPVYSDRDLDAEFPLSLDVEVDAQNERFSLRAVGDELAQVEAAAAEMVRDQLAEMIGEAAVQLYEGCPRQWVSDLMDVE